MYFLLLVLFGYRDPAQGVLWAIGITISLLVHEFGHALVARHLRHDPSIMLHTFGGLTSRSRTGRDVEEAAIVAMGPAAGLLLGLIVFGALRFFTARELVSPMAAWAVAQVLLYPCVVWNLLNLLPMWPLDGGQLFRLGAGRWMGPIRAARITHIVSLAVIALLAVWLFQHFSTFSLIILAMLAIQNVQGLQGSRGAVDAPRASSLAVELVDSANAALRDGNYKEAARLAHQARAQDGVSKTMMDRIWEILGVATAKVGDYEEALAYLKRAPPTAGVRAATEDALSNLGRQDELRDFQSRWTGTQSSNHMARWLVGALSFIAVAIVVIFSTPLASLIPR